MNAALQPARQGSRRRPLVIGLVNNMGVSALASTQAQFAGLLRASGRPTELVNFTMRHGAAWQHDHLPIDAITDRGIDAIIVTGMEVTASNLRDEWLWYSFTRLYDWCEQEAIPAIWSCLAAHAAVLHRDGIARQPLGTKLSGVFDCRRGDASHRLTNGMPQRWHCPHSRYNGLSAEALAAHGYIVLSQGASVGVDIFTHKDNPTSFYFQGHPEYYAETLLHEFLRDLRRYLAGEASFCPSVPATYLDTPMEREFEALREQALAGHDVLPAARSRAAQAMFRCDWTDAAIQLYANWLDIVKEHTSLRAGQAMSAGAAPRAGTPVP